MKILADENIPYARDAFGSLGEVSTISGRSMNVENVRDAELLLVRSITKVNASLLDGARTRFVATATIGEDHIDKAYLKDRGIAFSSAPGSNADSVRQYVTCALLELAAKFRLELSKMSIGIVGVGNVGSRVFGNASTLGMRCVLNDPPLARATGDAKYRPIEEVLECDIITLHTPLTKEGLDATRHLANADFIRRMKPGAILINSSRGAVADGAAIKKALDDKHLLACVLDVWENEPNIDAELLKKVFIGTPHIAGYSFDGKINGTRQIYEAACKFLGVEPTWNPAPLLPAAECPTVDVDGNDPDALRKTAKAVYDITRDDAATRALIDCLENERGTRFDRLRKEYPRRREFFNTTARIAPRNETLEKQLKGLGFTVET
jgi:erythronate-4-phosphate dehydrogenase